MTWFDYGVLIALALSVVVSLLRGFIRELVSLAGWVAAFLLAATFGGDAAKLMPESLGHALGGVIGFLAVFVGVLLIAGFVSLALSGVVQASKWTWTDRALGGAFGLLRGAIIVLAVVLVAGLTPLPREPFWRNAALSGPLETAALSLRPYFPEGLAQRIKYR